jgi:hypothetical protein
MKSFRFILLRFAAAMFSVLLLTVCCEERDPDTLTVSKSEFTFEADETGEQSAEITTTAETWKCLLSADWVSISISGNTLRVSVQNYTDTQSPRTATLEVQAGSAKPVSISVTQNARNTLSIDPESLSFASNETGDKPVTVTTSASSWDATADGAPWLSLSKQENTLKVTVSSQNTETSDRTATIRITAGSAPEKTLTVMQGKAHTLTVSPSSLSYAASETGTKTVAITTTAPEWDATTGESWIQLTKSGASLRVNVMSANSSTSSRSATIRVTAGTAPERTVTVTQAAAPNTLTVSPSSLSYTASETGTKTVTVTTNASSWDATTGDSWIQLTKSGASLRVNVTSANSSSSSRSATIRVTAGTAPEKTVTVVQSAVTTTLSVSPTSLSYTASETGTKTVTVTTNASSWDATTSASWIQLTKSGASLRVNVTSANSSTSSRSATITVTAGNASSKTVSVSQAGNSGFPQFPASTFTATGTPTSDNDLTPRSWTGLIVPGSTNFYGIMPWGGLEIPVYCDYVSGKILIDRLTKINEVDGYSIYFRALAINYSTGDAWDITEYAVTYNSSTRTLDFSGTYNGLSIAVGIVAVKGSGYVPMIMYTNLKLVLSSSSYAPQQLTQAVTAKTKAASATTPDLSKLLKNGKKITVTKTVNYSK